MRSITLRPGESLVLSDGTRIFAECPTEDAYADHLTTQELASMLWVDTRVVCSIKESNWDSIREGEHFVVLRKDDLREYKRLRVRPVSRQTTQLALWTPKGIALVSGIVGEGAASNSTFSAPDDLRPILNEILRTGIRKADVARRLGVERATITDASRPSDKPWMPTYANGVRLMQLHREVCGGEGGDA